MSTSVIVPKIPKCDLCTDPAIVDGKTKMGPWAYMCQLHYEAFGIGLGTGKGQRLVVKS